MKGRVGRWEHRRKAKAERGRDGARRLYSEGEAGPEHVNSNEGSKAGRRASQPASTHSEASQRLHRCRALTGAGEEGQGKGREGSSGRARPPKAQATATSSESSLVPPSVPRQIHCFFYIVFHPPFTHLHTNTTKEISHTHISLDRMWFSPQHC